MDVSANRFNSRALAMALLLLVTIASAFAQTVVAWGKNADGQCNVPASLANEVVIAVAAGGGHSLALTSGGKVFAWGNNLSGQCNVPTNLASQFVVAIAAGSSHSLALTNDGKVVAWGWNKYGQLNMPASLASKTVTAIAAGGLHSLALTSEGDCIAWGYNGQMQAVSRGSFPNEPWTDVAAGAWASMALVRGYVYEWGSVKHGWPGSFELVRFLCDPLVDGINVSVAEISAGANFRMARSDTGKVFTWSIDGNCVYGRYDPSFPDDPIFHIPPSLTNQTVTGISAGSETAFAITSAGRVVGWGSNTYGELDFPSDLADKIVTAIDARSHCLAIVNDPKAAPTVSISETSGAFIGGKAARVNGKVTFAFPSKSERIVYLEATPGPMSVPASFIVVPAGGTTATFKIDSIPVAARTSVVVIAKTKGYNVGFVEFALNPQTCSLSFTPSTLEGGTTATGKVALKTTSATDTTVTLASSSPLVNLPAGTSVFIPAGSLNGYFNITTSSVPATTPVVITATPGISTEPTSTTINLTAAPRLSSISTSRTTLYGNQKTTLTIKLASSPGAAGSKVYLTSGAGLELPDSVFFAKGVTTATVDVYAADDATDSTVNLVATSGFSAMGKMITLKELKLSGSTVPTSVKGGGDVLITVTLNAVVDREARASISVSDMSLFNMFSEGPAIAIPAGSKTGTITLTTRPTATQKSVKIYTSKGSYTSNKTLLITP